MKDLKAIDIQVKGLVQGVGFRPFIYRIANDCEIKGTVENRNDGVYIQAEASEKILKEFLEKIQVHAPPASHIEKIFVTETKWTGFTDFRIIKSTNTSDEITEISPDIAVCDDCLQDMKIQSHRISYPFINCTNCGPRFTIIKDLPYDREKTTMKEFIMCEQCSKEYKDVSDRRFHAQPVACNDCGPQYELFLDGKSYKKIEEIVEKVSSLIVDGKVLAVKGLGGFHLACDAMNDEAVKRMRTLKNREGKPFAVMCSSLDAIKKHAIVNAGEEKALLSWRRPIILLKEKSESTISKEVGVGLGNVGVMLPYMPLHYLLFEHLKTLAIVLTSGNISDEPIVIDNDIAATELAKISDALLIYNREIFNRTDDSVIFITNEKERIIRRSRGYVPNTVQLDFSTEGIFAAGAELKNCFCIGKGKQAILSQHIGDLKNLETYQFYKETVGQFLKLFRIEPDLFVGDLHPDYLSTKYIQGFDEKKIFVQHHYAHIASCMAEHHLDEKVMGVSFDGTGYGDDGNIWGGEFFICDLSDYERVSHFEYVPIPGGDKVSEEPWRMAVSYLYKVYGKDFLLLNLPFLKKIPEEKIHLLIQAIDKKINCPLTSSTGRLFDAVAAITDICIINGFEAEAPMRLEAALNKNTDEFYPFEISDVVCFDKTINAIVDDVLKGTEKSIIAVRFHNTIISVILDIVKTLRDKNNLNKVVLSGGVFQNKYLSENVENILFKNKFEVYSHSKVPSNDGGIALGQLVIAAKKRSLEKKS
jgi:hydrogenase maturation protein HypF